MRIKEKLSMAFDYFIAVGLVFGSIWLGSGVIRSLGEEEK